MYKKLLITSALVFSFLLAGCTPAPTGLVDPCPTPPVIEPMADDQWFEDTSVIVDQYGQQLVGFDEQAAQACVEDAGLVWRVIARDGEYFAVTADYSPQRLNAVIVDAIVMEITVG